MIKREINIMTPDSIRRVVQMMKNHFNMHTSKDISYHDSNGIQYSSSVYNKGKSIYLGSNKLKMLRPSPKKLSYNSTALFYFDITYSDLISTYDQQNMLCCNIQKDTLLPSKTYRIVFKDVVEFYAVRATNSSAGNYHEDPSKVVVKELFYKTSEDPILVVESHSPSGDIISDEYPISIRDNEDKSPTYYFYANDLSIGYTLEDGVLTTEPISDKLSGLPMIWFTIDSFKYLPSIEFENNIDKNGNPIMTFGMDGNGISRIYPNCYQDNFPEFNTMSGYNWYVKVTPKDGYDFNLYEPGKESLIDDNFKVPIKSIHLLYKDSPNGPEVPEMVDLEFNIPEDSNFVIYLDRLYYDETAKEIEWMFNERYSRDYDWDDVTKINPNFALALYNVPGWRDASFYYNHTEGKPMLPGFKVIFLNEHLYELESSLVGGSSSIELLNDSYDEVTKKYNPMVILSSIRDHNNSHTQNNIQRARVILNDGRVTIDSTDPVIYENNETTVFKKPDLTFARICDIPTSMMQLTNVPDYAPSVIVDWNSSDVPYVRTDCNFTIEDKTLLNNYPYDTLIKHENVIFPNDYDLDNVLSNTGDRYLTKVKLNESIDLKFDDNTTISIVNGGSGYNVNDVAKFNIGGRYYEALITEVNGSSVSKVSINDIIDVNISNLGSDKPVFNTSTTVGIGSGLMIQLTIDETYWNKHKPETFDIYRAGLYLYKYDGNDHVWIWIYDNIRDKWFEHIQVTGPDVKSTAYNHGYSFIDTYLKNLLTNNTLSMNVKSMTTPPSSEYNMKTYSREVDINPNLIEYDLNEDIDKLDMNHQFSYYVLSPSGTKSKLTIHSRYHSSTNDTNGYEFPRFHKLNMESSYNNLTNRLHFIIDSYKQPDVYFFDNYESNYPTMNNIGNDTYALTKSRLLNYNDLIPDELDEINDSFFAKQNIYLYDDSISKINELRESYESKSLEELQQYLRETFGEYARPLQYYYNKEQIIDYLMMVPQSTYEHSPMRRVVSKNTVVAQRIFENNIPTIVSTGGEQPKGMFTSVTRDVHDIRYSTNGDTTSDILFIFKIEKTNELVSLKNCRIIDSNGKDISEHSLIVYDQRTYYFDTTDNTWISK